MWCSWQYYDAIQLMCSECIAKIHGVNVRTFCFNKGLGLVLHCNFSTAVMVDGTTWIVPFYIWPQHVLKAMLKPPWITQPLSPLSLSQPGVVQQWFRKSEVSNTNEHNGYDWHVARHILWSGFLVENQIRRLISFTTKSKRPRKNTAKLLLFIQQLQNLTKRRHNDDQIMTII